MKFNEEIKIARKLAKLTQKETAQLLRVSKRSIESWEAGTRQPQEGEQERILTILTNLTLTRKEQVANQLILILRKECDILNPRQQARLDQTAKELKHED